MRARSTPHFIVFLVLCLALAPCAGMTCVAPMARAQTAGRAVVIVVEGGAGDAVASAIAAHVDAPHLVRDAHPFLAALGARGTPLLAPGIDNHAIHSQLVGQTAPSEGTSEAPTRDNALVVLQANVEAASRHVSYVDRITASLRPYDVLPAPLASIAIDVYPFARLRIPRVIGGLGVTGDYARAFALSSKDVAGGGSVATQWQSFDFGLRERVAIDRAFVLGIDVGYGAIDFTFDKPAFVAQLPSVGYRFIRTAADLRRAQGDFAVYAGAGYLFVLSAGEMGALFPRESAGGIEARIGASYKLARAFELSLGIGYTRFFYSMHPQPGDANVAGGALDEMARLSLGLAYLL